MTVYYSHGAYPVSKKLRNEFRQRLVEREIEFAKQRAIELPRSLNCVQRTRVSGDMHTPCLGGSGNCLCPCHDDEVWE